MSALVDSGMSADVTGGAGNDAISVWAERPIAVSGGQGDDVIALNGGQVGLFYDLGNGTDQVAFGAGTDVFVQISKELTGFSVEQGADTLTLRIGDGAITFSGLMESGAIGVSLGMGEMLVS